MTPDQFLTQIRKQEPAPVYLFIGPEPYRRQICRRALIDRVLPAEEREEGLIRHDLEETALNAVLDDARSLSLFAPRRVIWVASAEAALPRGRSSRSEDDDGARSSGNPLAGYLKDPAPDVVLVLDASRYEFEGEDKQKSERVRKFYSGVRAQVEFPRFSVQEARQLASQLAREAELDLDRVGIDLLVESLGADAMRISAEIDKLALYAAPGKKIGPEDIAALVPDSSASSIFVLVDALGRRDRRRALDLLHTLVRQGEYLPLVLTFLGAHFRLALAAQELDLRSAQQVMDRFSRPGRAVWRSKAEQILHTASIFSREQLDAVVRRVFEADKGLRDVRPDDRIVMEEFILRL